MDLKATLTTDSKSEMFISLLFVFSVNTAVLFEIIHLLWFIPSCPPNARAYYGLLLTCLDFN